MRRTSTFFVLLLSIGTGLVFEVLGILPIDTVYAAPDKSPGRLSGVVLGPDDKPVPHASVKYQSSAGIAPHAVRADAKGRFVIPKLPADNYDVRASSKGLFSEWEKNVSVHRGRDTNITLRLIYSREPLPKATPVKKPKS
jgi:hypothetical protein